VRSALNGLPMASTGHVGLATGPAVVGNIGSERAMRFDAVGHVTVVAKQLFDLNSHIGSRVLATSETADAAPQCVWRKLPVVRIDGSTSPLAASELLGVAGSIEPTQTSLLREFEQGRRLFDNRDYRGAIAVFDRIANRFPEDAPTLFFRDIAEGSLSGQ